jgi:hypothetical protein
LHQSKKEAKMKRIVKQLSRRNWRPAATAVTLLAALLISIPPAPAQTLTTIYSFKGSPDGATPGSVSGQGGVLYGTTNGGGTSGFGTAFSLTPPASSGGAWTETVLYDFGGGSDGINPNVGLAIGKDGSVCGTTAGGGTSNNGTVFCLTPPASSGGSWTEKVLHRFAGSPGDGARPFAGLWRTGGVIYGTTGFGGTTDSGTVFSLTPPASAGGAWTETVLYFFKGGSDGRDPLGSVLIGSGGVLTCDLADIGPNITTRGNGIEGLEWKSGKSDRSTFGRFLVLEFHWDKLDTDSVDGPAFPNIKVMNGYAFSGPEGKPPAAFVFPSFSGKIDGAYGAWLVWGLPDTNDSVDDVLGRNECAISRNKESSAFD